MVPDVDIYLPMLQLTLQLLMIFMRNHLRRMAAIRTRRLMLIRHYQAIMIARHRTVHKNRAQKRICLMRLAEGGTRRWWVYPRPSRWFRTHVMLIWEDEQWLDHFHMTKGTFLWLVDSLRPRLEREATTMRDPISVEERVAIAIWYLANTTSYRGISQVFGVGSSTVAVIVIEVCQAMKAELYSSTIQPGPPEQTMQGFAALGFPHCVGAMDSCHIYIKTPHMHQDPDAHINHKHQHQHSVLLQATVDHIGRFTDATIVNVGRNHDAHVLHSSNIFDTMDAGVWVPGNPTWTIEGVEIPPLIVADVPYPIRRWLMIPYTGTLTPEEARFNHVHSKAKSVVERAFGRLKARWHCLRFQLPVTEKNINSVICSCIILHNVCENHGHPVDWQEGEQNYIPIPGSDEPSAEVDARQQEEGIAVRSALTCWLQRQQRQ